MEDVAETAPTITTPVAPQAAAAPRQTEVSGPVAQVQPADKFEPTSTLEGLRKQIAHFAHERNWEQVSTIPFVL
jgi:hypothetical protein